MQHILALQEYTGGSPVMNAIQFVLLIVYCVGMMKVFTKAGEPAVAAFVPIWHRLTFLKIAGRPWWWLFLHALWITVIGFIVTIIVQVIMSIDLAKAFGKGAGYGVGLGLLGFIFAPMLGFGSDQYQGASSGGAAAPSPTA